MFTWISKRHPQALCRIAILALTLPLAGCLAEGSDGGMGFLSPSGVAKPSERPVLKQVSLFRGDVIVQGPAGYCIDRQSLRRGGEASFVLIASCETLSGKADIAVDPAVLTVTVLPQSATAQQPSSGDLAALAAPAKILHSRDRDGVSMIQLSQGGNTSLPGGDPRYWRGGMVINGHVVGLAVYGPKGSSVAGKQGQRLIMALAKTLRSLSPVSNDTPVSRGTMNEKLNNSTGLGALRGELFPESN